MRKAIAILPVVSAISHDYRSNRFTHNRHAEQQQIGKSPKAPA